MKKSEEKNKKYESPSTNKTQVEMEGNLCGSIETKNPEVEIKEQGVIDSDVNDFTGKEWGEIGGTTQN